MKLNSNSVQFLQCLSDRKMHIHVINAMHLLTQIIKITKLVTENAWKTDNYT